MKPVIKKVIDRSLKALTLTLFFMAFWGGMSHPANAQKPPFQQTGYASYYADKFHGRLTANGERFDQQAFTAAHRSLPFGTWVKVTCLENNKSVVVRINDRGPFVKGRIIDLSKKAAVQLGFVRKGVTKVRIELVDEAGRSRQLPDTLAKRPAVKLPLSVQVEDVKRWITVKPV